MKLERVAIKKRIGSTQSFTLIEMLISITILSIITGMGILNLTNYKNRHSFQLDATNILEGVRSAQNKAILGEQGTAWGIRFVPSTGSETDYYEIFSGTTYATSSVVDTQALSRASKFSNPSTGFIKTVIFSKITGIPDAAQSVVLQTSTGSDASVISISKSASLNQLPGKDLVGYWPLDEEIGTTVYDASGKGNTGTLNNGPTWESSSSGLCKTGGCLSFDGVDDEISIPNNAVYKSSSITLSFWANLQNQSKRHVLVTTWYGYTTEVNSDGTFKWGLSGPTGQYFGTQKINWNEWVYLTGTFDDASKQQCIYINGIMKECQTVTGSISYQSSPLFFSGSWDRAKGLIDDVRIYNRALATSEVKTLYESY